MQTRLVLTVVWGCILLCCACGSSGSPLSGMEVVEADSVGDGRVDAVEAGEEAEAGADAADQVETVEIVHEVLDAAEAVEVDVGILPGEAGWPCKTAGDCSSGFCIQTLDGPECTQTCVEECPFGWHCVVYPPALPDDVQVCAPVHVSHCRPCLTNSDCMVNGIDVGDACVETGAAGRFCGGTCLTDGDCPEGSHCKEATEAGGATSLQCVPDDPGACPCSDAFVDQGAETVCAVENEWGSCAGSRQCTAAGLGPCQAPVPMAEMCNGLDDDCDGAADEEVAAVPCSVANAFGECTGTKTCAAGQWTCDADKPAPDLCDGFDNDCDAAADEDFSDTDADGEADCIDLDVDGDGLPNEQDNCPKEVNPLQEDLDQDDQGDACDPDLDGDFVPNGIDNCPLDKNTTQTDVDEDGLGDACDADVDSDGLGNGEDNCPFVFNPGQADLDKDGEGDACENDKDGDGDPDESDCAPADSAISWLAAELCDGLDNNCNAKIDEGYPDTDQDGVADCIDHDWDNDGYPEWDDCNDLDKEVHPGAKEVCNGKDDDCNGLTDEGFGKLSCGKGECAHTLPACIDGKGQTCDPTEGAAMESCDGLDNDCDGLADEDLGWIPCGMGACQKLLYACEGGELTICDPFAGAAPEECNGKDDDCDGQVDEGLGLEACGLGTCAHTVSKCVGGVPQVCDPMQGALPEVCDGLDNDCDGTADEELGFTQCGMGQCSHIVDNCKEGKPQVCNPMQGASLETCDGLDNDCDGLKDEELGLTSCGQGVCAHSVPACKDGKPTPCDPMQGAGPELCNGKDDDCDGETDEELGQTTCGLGLCVHTQANCAAGKPQVCDPLQGSDPEVCNGLDDDCDGAADDELGQTTCGLGVCKHTVENCLGGLPQLCNPLEGTAEETCDGLDNDCDGQVDEQLGTTTCGQGICQHTVENCVGGVPQVCEPLDGSSPETCDGVDNDCDGNADEAGEVCAGCQAGVCQVASVFDGSLTPGTDLRFQYSPVQPGSGFVLANWTAVPEAVTYLVSVGSAPGAHDIANEVDVGPVTSATLSGLTLQGAWTGKTCYVGVAAVGTLGTGKMTVSNGLGIAEAKSWDGKSTAGLYGGYTVGWPEAGMTVFFGPHYFETVEIAADTVVYVQGWGKADNVGQGVSASDPAVVNPKDGGLLLYANSVSVAGTIAASGRGYGGGGGGGGGQGSPAVRGNGGSGGLGGNGGPSEGSYAGGGGGGSPGGVGGSGGSGKGGDGNRWGGGSGSTGCGGQPGHDGGDGPAGSVGGTGGTASSGTPGTGGTGEFGPGGGNGVSGCDNWTGGAGGGYGGGGSGGTQWDTGNVDAGGGGGGGTGGEGGGETPTGGKGAGPYGGAGGAANGSAGGNGGYLSAGGNGDSTTDRSLALGCGGGGGGAGWQETGGGGGGAGGGRILLYAASDLTVLPSARLLANGAGGGGGGRDNGGGSTSFVGGGGAGGGILLEAAKLVLGVGDPDHLSARGGDGSTANGGTVKLFYGTLTGPLPSGACAGRVFDAGPGSAQ